MNTDLKKYREGWDRIFKKEEEKPILDIFCGKCAFLKNNEKEQSLIYKNTGRRVFHCCLKYKERLYHGDYHPKILKCSKCKEKVKK